MPPTEKQARLLWSTVTALAVVVLLGIAGILVWGTGWIANRLSSVLLPLAVAGVLAFILDPLVDIFEVRLKSRMKSIWLVFILAFLLILGFFATVVPRLVIEVQSFFSQVPGYVMKVRDKADSFISNPPTWIPAPILRKIPLFSDRGFHPDSTNSIGLSNSYPIAGAPFHSASNTPPQLPPGQSSVPTNTTDALAQLPYPSVSHSTNQAVHPTGLPPERRFSLDLNRQLFSWAAGAMPALGNWALDQLSRVASVAGFLAGLALVPVYLFYFLLEKRSIQKRWTDFLPVSESQAKDEIIFILSSINDCLVVFFRGQVLVALCVGTLLTIGFSLLGLDYALLLGAMAGILGIVPYLGVAISLIPAVIIAIVQFGDWWHPIAVLGIFAAVQALEGLVISPKIIGERVGLHPLTVIIAVMTGTTLFGGILGGVLAIPATATLRAIMFRYVWKNKNSTSKSGASEYQSTPTPTPTPTRTPIGAPAPSPTPPQPAEPPRKGKDASRPNPNQKRPR